MQLFVLGFHLICVTLVYASYVLKCVASWKGVNIELNPDTYEDLVRNRRNDIANIHAAVCSEEAAVHYVHDATNKAVSGIWEFTTEQYRERYWPGITLYNTIEVLCTPLQSILDQTLGKNKAQHYFDFATIDLEGAELSTLLGIDFSRTKFGVLIIEKNESDKINQQIHELLQSRGYILMDNDESECGGRNWWFKHNTFEQIYSHLRNQAI